jgi:hypothetical protein
VNTVLPEYQLLLDAVAPLAYARADFGGWDDELWTRALSVAGWHRLSPALHRYLASESAVPTAVRAGLEQAYLANAARSAFIDAALRAALAALDRAEVPAMLLKGAALVQTVYSDPAVREMLDLDLLAPAGRLDAARDALAGLGYRAADVAGPDHHAPALIGEDRMLAVELHHHITIAGEGVKFDTGELWDRAREAPGATHLLPAPEDLLLHICMHFTRNRLGGSHSRRSTGGALAQIYDIAQIAEHDSIDWSAVADSARRYQLDASVFVALFAARELGVPIPEAALSGLQPATFDPALGRRLVALRVLRDEDRLPVRSARWMLLPSREVLSRGWNADRADPASLARAYIRRARANAPVMRSALGQPWMMVQDRRLNSEIHSLQELR